MDFRLNINGLAALVQQALGLDPFAACVYVFSKSAAQPPDIVPQQVRVIR